MEAERQFLRDMKIYENSNGLNQGAVNRITAFKRMYYSGQRISINNMKKNVAAKVIQAKFRNTNWSNYLSLNRVPKLYEINATGPTVGAYTKKLMTNMPKMTPLYRKITMAKLIAAYTKFYSKTAKAPFNPIYTWIKQIEPGSTPVQLRKLENISNKLQLYKKKHIAAAKIQERFRHYKTVPKTNENFMRIMNQGIGHPEGPNREKYRSLVKFARRKYGTSNLNSALEKIYQKRHSSPSAKKAVTVIQGAAYKYQKNRLEKIKILTDAMKRDGRFDYYAKVIIKLVKNILMVIQNINTYGNVHAPAIISRKIAVCHITPEEVPSKYLANMYNQLVHVTKEYAKKSSSARKKYLDRLDSLLSGRPCLENMMSGMVEALYEPVFEWKGKSIDPPLVQNNDRYLGNVMAKAVTSWQQKLSNNNKAKLPNNLNKRKNIFWGMVKNMELHVRNKNGIPIYSRPAFYNINGKKFKKSNLANTLEYI